MSLQEEIYNLLDAGVRYINDIYDCFPDNTHTEIQDALTALIEMEPPKIELSDGVYRGK